MIGIAISVTAKGGSINDQIITWLWNFEGTGVTTLKDGFRVCIGIRVDIVAYKTRESDAVIIRSCASRFITSRTSWRLSGVGKLSC